MISTLLSKPLSATSLARFRESEILFLADEGKKDTDERRIGRGAHCRILEGRRAYEAAFSSDGPVNKATGKPFGLDTQCVANWEEREGKTLLSAEMAMAIEAMAASVAAHERAGELFRTGKPEEWIEVDYCGVPCCGRMDFFTPAVRIVDLKTCADISSFESDARRNQYTNQMAFYRALAATKYGIRPHDIEVFFVAVEKAFPYRCGTWRIGQGVLGMAQQQNEEDIRRLVRCLETGVWRTGYEQMREFDWL